MEFVVVGPYCYGSGRTVLQALSSALDNYPQFARVRNYSEMNFNLYEASEDWDIDHTGDIFASSLIKLAEHRCGE